jgi:hypothetical protein
VRDGERGGDARSSVGDLAGEHADRERCERLEAVEMRGVRAPAGPVSLACWSRGDLLS